VVTSLAGACGGLAGTYTVRETLANSMTRSSADDCTEIGSTG
jgi:hypothetical protein